MKKALPVSKKYDSIDNLYAVQRRLRSFFRLDTVFGGVSSMMRMVNKVDPNPMKMSVTEKKRTLPYIGKRAEGIM